MMSSMQPGLGECNHPGQDGTVCVCSRDKLCQAVEARPHFSASVDQGVLAQGADGTAGEGGSGVRTVSEEAVINRVHPSSGMGTRSHSLTRHKAGCVCKRGWGSKGGGLMGEQAMTSLYPSTDH